MENIQDEDRRRRLRFLEEKIQDPRSVANIDSLLDTVQALLADCDHPAIKRMKNVEAYTNRCEYGTFDVERYDSAVRESWKKLGRTPRILSLRRRINCGRTTSGLGAVSFFIRTRCGQKYFFFFTFYFRASRGGTKNI